MKILFINVPSTEGPFYKWRFWAYRLKKGAGNEM